MSIEETILNGLINNNINFFINNATKYKDNDIFITYFNDYISGNLVDINNVYDNCLKNMNDKLINLIHNHLNEDNIKQFINDFIIFIINYDYDYKKKIDLINRLITDKFINHSDFLNYTIINFLINNKYIIKNKSSSFFIFLKLLKNKDMRENIIDYFKYKIEQSKKTKNIDSILDITDSDILLNESQSIFKINLCILLIELWINGITNSKLKNINNKNTNFLTTIYYQIHVLLDYSIIHIYEEKDYRLKELSRTKKILKKNTINSNNILINIKTKLTKILNSIYNITKNTKIVYIINEFYNYSIIWVNYNTKLEENKVAVGGIEVGKGDEDNYNHDHNEFVNDMLENMYIFFKHNKLELNDSITTLVTNIFNDNLTKNSNIKINYLYLVNNYILDIVDYNNKTLAIPNYVHYTKNIKDIIVSLLNVRNSLKKSFNNDEIYNMLYPMSIFSNIFNLTIYNLEDYRYIFYKNINTKYFKELLYDNLNNFQYISDEILLVLNTIQTIEFNSENREEIQLSIVEEKSKLNNLNIYLEIFSLFIIKSCKYYSSFMLCDEIKFCVTNIIISIINKLTRDQKKYKINDKSDLDFTPINLLNTLKSILIGLIFNRNNENSIIEIISANGNYIQNSILRLINILNKKNKIKPIDYSYLSYLDTKINLKLDNHIEKEIPDELCDPIMDTLIENPIMLPNNIIIDISTISRHLLSNETNPYDRTPLNMDILKKYNECIDVKKKIDEFKLKLKEFTNK